MACCFGVRDKPSAGMEEFYGVTLPSGYRSYFIQEKESPQLNGDGGAIPELFSSEPFKKMFWFHTLHHIQEESMGNCTCNIGFYEIEGHFDREVDRVLVALPKQQWTILEQTRDTQEVTMKLLKDGEIRHLNMKQGPQNEATGASLIGLMVYVFDGQPNPGAQGTPSEFL
eukprot:TRINITY_DN5521_c0_g1_i1.p1 TRINITY_DN5521_c0_g1~~TRINITY_DN5521_c0_g1_i1.p1  ORF type:complete len:170 (-),score=32.77 TRINITY_DN5521_c0_g1_i1:227-736(-)